MDFNKIMEFIKKYWVYLLGIFIVLTIARKLILPSRNSPFEEVQYSTIGATITNSEAKALASSLYSAMADFGTVESEIHRIRQIIGNNSYNLRAVYNAFGLKAYSTFGAPMYGWMSATDVDLKTWLYNELSDKDYKVWEQMFINAGVI